MESSINIQPHKPKWKALASRHSSDELLIDSLWQELESHYTQNNRHYHNLTHIADLLNQWEHFHHELSHPDIIQFAIWYHDVIYDIKRKDNEKKSADLAMLRLTQLGLSETQYTLCHDLILATKTHTLNNAKDLDVKWMIDFDLAILGRDWPIYIQYTQQVRKEYSLYPDLVFKPGRKKVLSTFLERERIYQTALYHHQYESQARENLKREMELL